MNQKLQNILDIIQQSEKLDAEQKDNLIKAVKDADKELEITAFKLERTEKVKKTTAILLEETIEELEQKRKAVEKQNRELEIESSLEKVRSVAMSMNKSDDLLKICEVSFKEFQKLGFDQLRNAVIHIPNDEQNFYMDYDYSESLGGAIAKIDYGSHPIVDEILEKIRSSKDAFFEVLIGENQLKGWREFRKKTGQQEDPRLDDATALYYYLFSIGIGDIGISTFKRINETQVKILKRFRNVFDLAYRRYNDITLAEEQAREAQIEASLERVRTVAMSMNKSDDLLKICEVSFKEFQKLGFDSLRNTVINVLNDEKRFFLDYDYSDHLGGSINNIKYNSHPIVENYLEQIKRADDAFAEVIIDGTELDGWKEFRRNVGQLDDPRLNETHALYYYLHSIGVGDIGISTFKPINESQIKIIQRFRNVFDLAYRRYTDITKAEAQAREAQIEAALERVRTNAMAMQNSNDLAKIVEIVFTELKKVGFETIRCGIGIIEGAETKKVDIWSTTLADEDLSIQISGDEVLEGHALLDGIIEHWINQTEFSYVLEGEDFFKYYKAVEKTNFHLPDYAQQNLSSDEKQYYYMVPCKAGGIYAFSIVPFTDEVKKLMRRFIEVFQLAYTRYVDLQKAEAQAKEAIRQASLDRVRGEIASMRTSEDLNRITPIIWRELKNLEIPFFRCGVFIIDEAQQRTQVYLTTPDGKSLGVLNLPFNSNKLTINTVEYWKKKKVYKEHWSREEFINWTKSMMELGQVQSAETYQGSSNPPDSLHLHFVPFTQGMLYVGDVSPLTDEKLDLVKTLAEAFSIAYARYEDFKNLEDAKNKIEITLTDLKSAQVQLVHSEKMASLGELTAGIAHEIKNPLNFVNNFSEISRELLDEMKVEIQNKNLDEVIELIEDLKQNLEKINQHGKRADSIVKGMLLHSRGTSGEKTPTDINDLLEQYVNLAYHGMRAQNKEFNITIEKDYDDTLEKINVVPQDISRVFLNIINNACYAANEKKKKSGNDFSPILKVSTKNQNGKVEIRIADNGNGIPKDIIDKIYQPFFTTKPTGEGTGLGLSLSYDIVVKQHGGQLKVETTEGEGTKFMLILNI